MKKFASLLPYGFALCFWLGWVTVLPAQGTSFTYQGRLTVGTNPANGSYDLSAALFSVASGAGQVGATQTILGTAVSNGFFTVSLDFGNNFSGAARWLELGFRTNGNGAYSILSPRQRITPTPYAITASNLTGTLPTSQLLGALPPALLGGTYTNNLSFNNAANSFVGDGTGLSGVDAVTLDGLAANAFWRIAGNAGTASNNFLGTTDNQALELRANGVRALRLKPTPSGAPNLIAGSSNNFAGQILAGILTEDTTGVAIGGGDSNRVSGNFSVISGGQANIIQTNSPFANIAGGRFNNVAGINSAIAGGESNALQITVSSSIGGGSANRITGLPGAGAAYQTIGGGISNVIVSHGANLEAGNTIGGGVQNDIAYQTGSSTIGGGARNGIATDSSGSTISGGTGNDIDSAVATISGGSGNSISSYTFDGSAIGGGVANQIVTSMNSAIGGGSRNAITGTGGWGGASIGGGNNNTITIGSGGGPGPFGVTGATIAGGYTNSIGDAWAATVGGGYSNRIVGGALLATIPGGAQARAANYGQLAYASGQFAASGDAQTSVHVLRGTTVNATAADLFLNGTSARIVVPLNSTWSYDILVAARTATGTSAGYLIRGVVENNAGTTALVGPPNITVLAEDDTAWDATVLADNATDSLVVRVSGTAGTTIRWVATVRTTEVTF